MHGGALAESRRREQGPPGARAQVLSTGHLEASRPGMPRRLRAPHRSAPGGARCWGGVWRTPQCVHSQCTDSSAGRPAAQAPALPSPAGASVSKQKPTVCGPTRGDPQPLGRGWRTAVGLGGAPTGCRFVGAAEGRAVGASLSLQFFKKQHVWPTLFTRGEEAKQQTTLWGVCVWGGGREPNVS